MSGIRVLTWNLWWRRGPWRARYAAVAETLQALRPDICALQEVWIDSEKNVVEWLATQLGMHSIWVPSPTPERWNQRISDPTVIVGNAVLSRWPILASEHLDLPSGGAVNEGRTAVFALVQGPHCRIPIFTTHLNSALHQSAVRCAQVRALAHFVADRSILDFPPVVTGDFNAEPDSDEIRLIGGRNTASPVPGLLLLDAWHYANPPSDGLTWNRANEFAALHWAPSARIDYVFVGPPMASGAGKIESIRLIGDGPVRGVWPSDHAGILAELAVPQ